MRERDPAGREDGWESSTWEGNRRWHLDRALASSPLDRLLWLEEALRLAWSAGALAGDERFAGRPASATPPRG